MSVAEARPNSCTPAECYVYRHKRGSLHTEKLFDTHHTFKVSSTQFNRTVPTNQQSARLNNAGGIA